MGTFSNRVLLGVIRTVDDGRPNRTALFNGMTTGALAALRVLDHEHPQMLVQEFF